MSELTDDDIDLVAKKVLGEEAKVQQELEAKKNDPRRQEAIASLFHVRDRDKVRYVAVRSRSSSRSWNVRDRDKVGSEEGKEQQEQEAQKNGHIFCMALFFACLPQGRSWIRISSGTGLFASNSDKEKRTYSSYECSSSEHPNQSKH